MRTLNHILLFTDKYFNRFVLNDFMWRISVLSSGHRLSWRLIISSIIIGVAVSLSACSEKAVQAAVTAALSGEVVSVTNLTNPVGVEGVGTSTRKIRYRMPAVRGGLTEANAMLFIPGGAAPLGGWPLVVWAHGTTGVADGCAPSRNYASLGDVKVVNTLVGSGFAVLAPDYEGLDAPGIHPYYNRSSHAQSVLQAVKAATNISGISLSKKWSIIGHSQGGHVALSAAQSAGELGSSYELRSVVAFAPGSDLIASSDAIFSLIDTTAATGNIEGAASILYQTNFNGAFVLLGLEAMDARVDASQFVGANLASLLNTARNDSDCTQFRTALFDSLRGYLNSGGNVLNYPGVKRDWANNTIVREVINNNKVGETRLSAPVLIIQGTADIQVPFVVTNALIGKMQANGTSVARIDVPNGDHDDIVENKFADAISFVRNRL
jgi:pimeloyl-ACP methyl ester carboxylesterase